MSSIVEGTCTVNTPKNQKFILVEADLNPGTIRIWNGLGDLGALGESWFGVGQLMNVTASLEGKIPEICFTNVPLELQHLLPKDAPARVYVGAFDPLTHKVMVDPVKVIDGVLRPAFC